MVAVKKELLIFLIVGTIIFVFDVIFFKILYHVFNNQVASRVLSYLMSTSFAWRLNSIFTFKKNGSFLRYLLGASLSGVQNIAVSLLLIDKLHPFMAIGAGCLWGLFFNYFFQRKITFK